MEIELVGHHQDDYPKPIHTIEVKYTANPAPSDARGIERFLARFPRLARRGFVVCRVNRPEQLTRRVRAIPWEQL